MYLYEYMYIHMPLFASLSQGGISTLHFAVDSSGCNVTGLNWTGLDWNGLDWTGLRATTQGHLLRKSTQGHRAIQSLRYPKGQYSSIYSI